VAAADLPHLRGLEEIRRQAGVEDAGAVALRAGCAGGERVAQTLPEVDLTEAGADEPREEHIARADRADHGLEGRDVAPEHPLLAADLEAGYAAVGGLDDRVARPHLAHH